MRGRSYVLTMTENEKQSGCGKPGEQDMLSPGAGTRPPGDEAMPAAEVGGEALPGGVASRDQVAATPRPAKGVRQAGKVKKEPGEASGRGKEKKKRVGFPENPEMTVEQGQARRREKAGKEEQNEKTRSNPPSGSSSSRPSGAGPVEELREKLGTWDITPVSASLCEEFDAEALNQRTSSGPRGTNVGSPLMRCPCCVGEQIFEATNPGGLVQHLTKSHPNEILSRGAVAQLNRMNRGSA